MLYGIAAAFVLAVAPASPQTGPLRTLEPEQMEADLLLLLDTLVAQHGGLYRYTTADELDAAFGEAMDAASEPLSILEFHRVVARIVSLVRCGHTHSSLDGRDWTAIFERSGALPFEVHLEGDRAWVVRTLGDDVPLAPGDELLAIDGIGIAEARERALPRLVTDGFNVTQKERLLERRFGELFVALVDDADAVRERHEVRVAGQEEPVLVAGLSSAAYQAGLSPRNAGPLIELEPLGSDVARLSVRAFADPAEGPFPEVLAAAFDRVRRAEYASLVLDLRGNGGGDDTYGALLVSYFSPEPFRYFERIEVTDEFEGPGDVVERDGMRLVTAHPGLQVQPPSEPGFAGELFVLIDGWTFSTAADVATVLHHHRLGTFLGEETGGGYDGNTSGVSMQIALPSSRIRVSVPHWMYTTANLGHDHAGRGVPADVVMRPSIDDVLAGRDPVLERALELARADGGGGKPGESPGRGGGESARGRAEGVDKRRGSPHPLGRAAERLPRANSPIHMGDRNRRRRP